MKYLFTFLLPLIVLFSCTSESSSSKENPSTSTPPSLQSNNQKTASTAISKEESNQLLKKIEKVQTDICSGQLKVDEIYNYQLDGKSMGFYLKQNIMLFPQEDQDTYQNLKKKADCCLKAIVEHTDCEYLSK